MKSVRIRISSNFLDQEEDAMEISDIDMARIAIAMEDHSDMISYYLDLET